MTEDDEQWAKLTLDAVREHRPHIFQNMEVDIEGFAELYVVPLSTASLDITDEMLAATKQLLFPDDKDAYAATKTAWGSRSPRTVRNGIPSAAPDCSSSTSALCW